MILGASAQLLQNPVDIEKRRDRNDLSDVSVFVASALLVSAKRRLLHQGLAIGLGTAPVA